MKKKDVKKPEVKGAEHSGATVAAILGLTSGNGVKKQNNNADKDQLHRVKIRSEWEKYYENLHELRDRLLNQMNGLAKESAETMAGYSLHMADSGTDNFDRDFALSLLSSDQDAVYEIEEAIKRIERESYGVCELTGKNIPKARLTAIPWPRVTVEAQGQLERDGVLRQRRLGALGSIDSNSSVEIDDDDEPEEKPTKEKE